MSNNIFTFNGIEYPTLGSVASQVGKFETLEEEVEFLKAYQAKYPYGMGNISYFLGCDPHYIAFKSKHPLRGKLGAAERNLEDIKNQMSKEYSEFYLNLYKVDI